MRIQLPLFACLLGGLVGVAALAGIFVPAVYAQETAGWAAQGLGQDWVDLVVVAPALVGCGVLIRGGSRAAVLVFGGLAVYVLYSFAVYAFAMHFNVLFLVYCAALGLAFYSAIGVTACVIRREPAAWFPAPRYRRATAVLLMIVAAAFYALWLGSVVPALMRGAPPPELVELGLITNPVHVLDLAIVLPAMAITGILVWRRQPVGLVLAPIMLVFTIAMALALVGMMIAMEVRGLPASAGVAVTLGIVAVASTLVLVATLRGLGPARWHR